MIHHYSEIISVEERLPVIGESPFVIEEIKSAPFLVFGRKKYTNHAFDWHKEYFNYDKKTWGLAESYDVLFWTHLPKSPVEIEWREMTKEELETQNILQMCRENDTNEC